jgi:Protein of unknown function (DUF4089)
MPGKAKTARKAKPQARRSRGKSANSIDALVTASAQALRLPIDPAWRPAVKINVQLLLKHAALVEEFLLSDDTEPAPVFRA